MIEFAISVEANAMIIRPGLSAFFILVAVTGWTPWAPSAIATDALTAPSTPADSKIADQAALISQLSNPNEAVRSTARDQIVAMINSDSTAMFKALASACDSPNSARRLEAKNLFNRLMIGPYPSYLQNRLGDVPAEELISSGQKVIEQHEALVEDWRKFLALTSEDKESRKRVLALLQTAPNLLSSSDVDSIGRQLEELNWSKEVVQFRYANALLMLGYNYHYLFGMSARAKAVAALKDAITVWPGIATEALLEDVAKKSLALEDESFNTLYTKALEKTTGKTE